MGLSRSISGLGHAAANGFVKWSNFSKPNFAAVLHGINDMRFEEFPLASTLKEGQVLSCLFLCHCLWRFCSTLLICMPCTV